MASFAVCALCSLRHRFCGMFNIFPLHLTIPKIKRKGSVPLKTGENKLQFVCVIQRHRQSKRKMISEEQAVLYSAQFTQRNDGPHNPLWRSISGRFLVQKGHSFHNSSPSPPAWDVFYQFPHRSASLTRILRPSASHGKLDWPNRVALMVLPSSSLYCCCCGCYYSRPSE